MEYFPLSESPLKTSPRIFLLQELILGLPHNLYFSVLCSSSLTRNISLLRPYLPKLRISFSLETELRVSFPSLCVHNDLEILNDFSVTSNIQLTDSIKDNLLRTSTFQRNILLTPSDINN